jgi:hypothetical protein
MDKIAVLFLFEFQSKECRGADESLWTEQEEQFPEIILISTLLSTRFYLFSSGDTLISSANFILMQLAFCFARAVAARQARSNHITYNGSVSRVVTA